MNITSVKLFIFPPFASSVPHSAAAQGKAVELFDVLTCEAELRKTV